jgi:hypothetical protein
MRKTGTARRSRPTQNDYAAATPTAPATTAAAALPTAATAAAIGTAASSAASRSHCAFQHVAFRCRRLRATSDRQRIHVREPLRLTHPCSFAFFFYLTAAIRLVLFFFEPRRARPISWAKPRWVGQAGSCSGAASLSLPPACPLSPRSSSRAVRPPSWPTAGWRPQAAGAHTSTNDRKARGGDARTKCGTAARCCTFRAARSLFRAAALSVATDCVGPRSCWGRADLWFSGQMQPIRAVVACVSAPLFPSCARLPPRAVEALPLRLRALRH